jgi:large subunit ribosomal protein L13
MSSSINAEKVVLTGNKTQGQALSLASPATIGGIKDRSPKEFLDGKTPERVVEKAVQRMLPRGPLGKHQFANLRVYAGTIIRTSASSPKAGCRCDEPKNTNYRKVKAG